ncbi:pyridoxamine 5'-phosphate oxidase family protein [Mycolicibacterium stellerae]|uniref:pyridoxamine 5'-phosphate oxidase family protein n=1 Tax=Mycolicibacterium stellerae TaxID=2358193 RepID=UPI000F0B954E|nr:pyridoxamine 5'-phosphate oxidase family protein [Mycolicibacterium stellerae]
MSVKVDLDRLADELANYKFAYLVTVGDDFHAHTVAVEPVFVDGRFDVGPVGGTTSRNLASHDSATLVWPPSAPGGYTLIVDGRADSRYVVPDRAVLHRKAPPGVATKPGCKDDCHPLERS